MDPAVKRNIVATYRQSLLEHGDGPQAVQYTDVGGQHFRFEQLATIADLTGRRVLDLGCGIGDLYPYLIRRFGHVKYTGVDLVTESIDLARRKYPGARFLCRDIVQAKLSEKFEYVLMCGVFNNRTAGTDEFLCELVSAAYESCTVGVGFNFLSTFANFTDSGMAYHDPTAIMEFCLTQLSRKVNVHHHYERADVAVFVYRES